MKSFTISVLLVCLFFSSNAQIETNWTSLHLNAPFNTITRNISVVNGNVVWGTQYPNRCFRTIDGGQTFDENLLQLAPERFISDIMAIDENIAFTATSSGSGDPVEGIHRTVDGGQNWDLVFDEVQDSLETVSVHFFDVLNGVFYAFENTQTDFDAVFYWTEDGGDTWTKSISEFPLTSIWTEGGNDGITAVGDIAWVSHVKNVIFKSYDRGKTWVSLSTPFTNNTINDVAFKNEMEGLSISSLNNPNQLIRTTNGGLIWNEIPIPPDVDANNLEYIPGTTGGYIITAGDDINTEFMYTLDDGDNWHLAEAPSSLHCVEFLSPTLGFGGTRTQNGGLLKYDDTLFASVTPIVSIDTKSHVEVFPNPVFGIVNIEIENDWRGEINLQIINDFGQHIFSDSPEKPFDKIRHQINTSNLPIGNYQLLLLKEKEVIIRSFVKVSE